jgi:hypothetical protein
MSPVRPNQMLPGRYECQKLGKFAHSPLMCKKEEKARYSIKQDASISSLHVCNPRIANRVFVFEDLRKPCETRYVGSAVSIVSEHFMHNMIKVR